MILPRWIELLWAFNFTAMGLFQIFAPPYRSTDIGVGIGYLVFGLMLAVGKRAFVTWRDGTK